MRSVSSAYRTELQQTAGTALISLVDIEASTAILRCNWSASVSYGGQTYVPDALAYGPIRQDLEGNRPRYELSLQNVRDVVTDAERPWSTYLASNDLNGTEVITRVVHKDHLDDSDAVLLEQRWYISGWTFDRTFVRFGLGSPHDALAHETPRMAIGGVTCWWRYGEGPCTNSEKVNGYKDCPYTVDGCLARTPKGSALPIGPSYVFMSKQSRGRR